MANFFDQFDAPAQPPTGGNFFDQFDAPKAPAGGLNLFSPVNANQNTSYLGDIGTSLKRGVQQIPGMATGLADIPMGLMGLDRPFGRSADWLGEVTGFRPAQWAKAAEQQYSPEQQAAQAAANQAWQQAGQQWDTDKLGAVGTVAGAYLQNPRLVGTMIAESLPSTVVGGVVGRGLNVAQGGLGALQKAVAAGTGAAEGSAQALAAKAAQQSLNLRGALYGGVGEGAVTAGQAMEQTDQKVDPTRAAIGALGAGAFTGAIGGTSGLLARRLGVADPEAMFAAADRTALSSLPKRLPLAALQEGVFEELPQSMQEQAWQNWAEGKPLGEGVARAGVEGLLAGMGMGAGFQLAARKPVDLLQLPTTPSSAPPVAPLPTDSQLDLFGPPPVAPQNQPLTDDQIRAEQQRRAEWNAGLDAQIFRLNELMAVAEANQDAPTFYALQDEMMQLEAQRLRSGDEGVVNNDQPGLGFAPPSRERAIARAKEWLELVDTNAPGARSDTAKTAAIATSLGLDPAGGNLINRIRTVVINEAFKPAPAAQPAATAPAPAQPDLFDTSTPHDLLTQQPSPATGGPLQRPDISPTEQAAWDQLAQELLAARAAVGQGNAQTQGAAPARQAPQAPAQGGQAVQAVKPGTKAALQVMVNAAHAEGSDEHVTLTNAIDTAKTYLQARKALAKAGPEGLRIALRTAPENEKAIVQAATGMDADGHQVEAGLPTYADVGKKAGVSAARVAQILKTYGITAEVLTRMAAASAPDVTLAELAPSQQDEGGTENLGYDVVDSPNQTHVIPYESAASRQLTAQADQLLRTAEGAPEYQSAAEVRGETIAQANREAAALKGMQEAIEAFATNSRRGEAQSTWDELSEAMSPKGPDFSELHPRDMISWLDRYLSVLDEVEGKPFDEQWRALQAAHQDELRSLYEPREGSPNQGVDSQSFGGAADTTRVEGSSASPDSGVRQLERRAEPGTGTAPVAAEPGVARQDKEKPAAKITRKRKAPVPAWNELAKEDQDMLVELSQGGDPVRLNNAVNALVERLLVGPQYSKAGSRLDAAIAQWKTVVAALEAGTLDRTVMHLMFPTTPASMQILGAPNLPVLVKFHALDYLNQRISRGQMESLPAEMADPVAVTMHEETHGGLSLLFVTRMTTSDGLVAVALQPNTHDPRGGHANYVATIVPLRASAFLRELREGRAAYLGDLSSVPGAKEAAQFGKRNSGKEAVKFRDSISRKFVLPAALNRIAYKSDLVKMVASGQAQFSLQETPQGTTVDRLHAAMRELFGQAESQKVKIYQTAAEAQADPENRSVAIDGQTQAFVNHGKAYLIADNINPGEERAVFLHEVGSHLGLQRLLGPERFNRLVNQLKAWAARNDDSQESQLAQAALARVQAAGTSTAQHDSETVAYFIEEAVKAGVDPTALNYRSELGRWFRQLWAAFKSALRHLGVVNLDKLTARDVVDLAYGAARLELHGTWHGTAARFRNFNTDYMGTGEGAQAYGWGVYVAGREGIGRGYMEGDVRRKTRDADTQSYFYYDGERLPEATNDIRTFAKIVVAQYGAGFIGGTSSYAIAKYFGVSADEAEEVEKIAKTLDVRKTAYKQHRKVIKGSLMRADINANEDEFLQWDALLSEQSEFVKQALRDDKAFAAFADMSDYFYGEHFYNHLEVLLGSDKAASKYLRSLGIKGNKHIDARSRRMRRQGVSEAEFPTTYNYIVFDDRDVQRVATEIGGDRAQVAFSRASVVLSQGRDVGAGLMPFSRTMYHDIMYRGVAVGFVSLEVARDGTVTALYSIRVADAFRKGGVGSEVLKNILQSNPSIVIEGITDEKARQWWLNRGAYIEGTRGTLTLAGFEAAARRRATGEVDADTRGRGRGVARAGAEPSTPVGSAETNAEDPQYSRRLDQVIQSTPYLRQRQGFVRSLLSKFTGTADWAMPLMFGHQLAAHAAKWLPSAQKYFDTVSNRMSERVKAEQDVARIADDFYQQLNDREQAAVNSFLMDSTRAQKWGYVPTWDTTVAPDPEFAKRFQAMSSTQRDIIERVFQHGHDQHQAVTDAINANLPPGEQRLRAQLHGPYAPLKRFGDYVVVARSKAYQEAEANDDRSTLFKLRSDERHYYVEFLDSEAAAIDRANALRGQLPDMKVQEFQTAEEARLLQEMGFQTFKRLETVIGADDKLAAKAKAAIQTALNQLYIASLNRLHAQKSDLMRHNVAGADQDMMRAFISQGRSEAALLATLRTDADTQETLQTLRRQARDSNDRLGASKVLNEILKRHLDMANYRETPVQDALLRASSLYHLLLSPAYFLTNMTQPGVVSLPVMAGKHGIGKSTAALTAAYQALYGQLHLLQRGGGFDLASANTLAGNVHDEAGMLKELADKNIIDPGMDIELGELSARGSTTLAGKAVDKVSSYTRSLVRNIEALNRVSTALAAYRLEFARQRTEGKTADGAHTIATEYARRIVVATHGDYSGHNAPRWFMQGDKPLPVKVMAQFKKFQLIQIGVLVKLARDGWINDLPKPEAAAARASLYYLLGTQMALCGVLGLPVIKMASLLALLGGGPGDDDPEAYLRRAIGDPTLAQLLLHGAPAVLGVDVSKRLGMANVWNPVPFADSRKQGKEGLADILMSLAGAPLGMAAKVAEGVGQLEKGRYWRGLELMLPNGLATNLSKVARYEMEGVATRRGDVMLHPEDISFMDDIAQLIGTPTTTLSDRTWKADVAYRTEEQFKSKTAALKEAYEKAARDHDSAAMGQARQEWMALQQSKRELGFKAQPLADLLKSPMEQTKRERNVAGGMSYNRGNRRYIQELAGL